MKETCRAGLGGTAPSCVAGPGRKPGGCSVVTGKGDLWDLFWEIFLRAMECDWSLEAQERLIDMGSPNPRLPLETKCLDSTPRSAVVCSCSSPAEAGLSDSGEASGQW